MDLAHIIRTGIERRIDIDQLDLAAKTVGQQVREYVLVVAMEQQSAAGILIRPVRPQGVIGRRPIHLFGSVRRKTLHLLRRKSPHMGERPLADPGQHRPSLGLGDIDVGVCIHAISKFKNFWGSSNELALRCDAMIGFVRFRSDCIH